jgi:hypothetical protein
VGQHVTAEQQEALFQAIIRKIPSVGDIGQLQEAATLALALMLRRPADRELRDELTHQILGIIAEVKPGHAPDAMRNELRFAARGCIKVLQAAKERRLPRKAQMAADNWAQSDGKQRFKPVHHPDEGEVGGGNTRKVTAVVLLLLAVLGGYIWWSGTHGGDSVDSSDAGKFARQMMDAAKGGGPDTHMFGGSLKVVSLGGRPVVVAEKVPPSICAAAGWALVRGGVLSINGVTPNRISAGKITELCNSEDGDASIMWSPK